MTLLRTARFLSDLLGIRRTDIFFPISANFELLLPNTPVKFQRFVTCQRYVVLKNWPKKLWPSVLLNASRSVLSSSSVLSSFIAGN